MSSTLAPPGGSTTRRRKPAACARRKSASTTGVRRRPPLRSSSRRGWPRSATGPRPILGPRAGPFPQPPPGGERRGGFHSHDRYPRTPRALRSQPPNAPAWGCALAQAAPGEKPPRHDDHALGIGVDPLLPVDGMRRPARHAKPLVAAGNGDELRSPVTAVEGRVDPFEAHHSSPGPPGNALLDSGDAPSKRIADALRDSGPARQPTNNADVLEDVLNGLRFERDELRRGTQPAYGPFHDRIGDGADLAELLREDQVGAERLQERRIERVDAAALVDELANVPIDLGTRTRARQDAAGEHRLVPDPGGG